MEAKSGTGCTFLMLPKDKVKIDIKESCAVSLLVENCTKALFSSDACAFTLHACKGNHRPNLTRNGNIPLFVGSNLDIRATGIFHYIYYPTLDIRAREMAT